MKPRPHIILLGNSYGVAKIAQKLKLTHIKHIKLNRFGTPLVNDVFSKAEKNAKGEIIVYINSDIILKQGVSQTIKRANQCFPRFLLIGRRYEGYVTSLRLGGSSWVDYFIFTKGIFKKIPAFAIGRTFWDKWLIYQALKNKVAVVDVTKTVVAIHQSHSYSHAKLGAKGVWQGVEAEHNVRLAGGWGNGATIADACFMSVLSAPFFVKKGIRLKNLRIFYRNIINICSRSRFIHLLILKLRFWRWSHAKKF